jgi:hypothetical protein
MSETNVNTLYAFADVVAGHALVEDIAAGDIAKGFDSLSDVSRADEFGRHEGQLRLHIRPTRIQSADVVVCLAAQRSSPLRGHSACNGYD